MPNNTFGNSKNWLVANNDEKNHRKHSWLQWDWHSVLQAAVRIHSQPTIWKPGSLNFAWFPTFFLFSSRENNFVIPKNVGERRTFCVKLEEPTYSGSLHLYCADHTPFSGHSWKDFQGSSTTNCATWQLVDARSRNTVTTPSVASNRRQDDLSTICFGDRAFYPWTDIFMTGEDFVVDVLRWGPAISLNCFSSSCARQNVRVATSKTWKKRRLAPFLTLLLCSGLFKYV